MKRKMLARMVILGLAFSLMLVGCDQCTDPEESGVSFENFISPSIKVENLTGERLVAFKGSLSPNTLISGIPAFSGVHGLKKDPALFNNTGAFALILITEDQYIENKKNLPALNNQVFARIFAFYNNSATNNNVFPISSKLGGQGRLEVRNPTGYDVEIRKDGPDGEILGYVGKNMTGGNIIYLQSPEIYHIYPVFKFFHPTENILHSTTPKYTEGDLVGKPFMKIIPISDKELNHTFNISEVNVAKFNLTSGGAYIKIINNSGTGVEISNGGKPLITSTGLPAISSGGRDSFSLNFGRNADDSYPAESSFSQLTIDVGQNTKPIPAPTEDSGKYMLDYMYEVEITGSNVSTLQVGAPVKKGRIDLEKYFGLTD
jgi:hypothetical protein